MQLKLPLILLAALSISNIIAINCQGQKQSPSIIGTWRLLSGTTITKGDTAVVDYTKNQKMIKIINKTHFAFLRHDLSSGKGADSAYESGAGTYNLSGNQYTEHLEYCNYREWEGKSFQFTVTIKNDTLIQRGLEKVEEAGVNREIIERYVRVSK
jgi:lipopolysaccharide export system protein LptA